MASECWFSTHIGTLFSLVCPVSNSSCWVYAAGVSLGPSKPNYRAAKEPLPRPRKRREVDFSNRCCDTSTSRRSAYAGSIIGPWRMHALKALQQVACSMETGVWDAARTKIPLEEKRSGGQALDRRPRVREAYQVAIVYRCPAVGIAGAGPGPPSGLCAPKLASR